MKLSTRPGTSTGDSAVTIICNDIVGVNISFLLMFALGA